MFDKRRHRTELKRLIGQWVEFRDLVQLHYGQETATQVVERRFLDLKGNIAERLATVGSILPAHYAAEAAGAQKGMLDFMNRYPSLHNGKAMSEEQKDDFERAWQRFYLHLNQFKGMPVDPRGARARHRAPIADASVHRSHRLQHFFGNWFVKLVLTVAVVVGALWVLSWIIPWERLGVGPRITNFGRGAVDTGGRWLDSATSGGGFLAGIRNFFDPVVAQYGPETTVIMATVLLIAFGYWVFIRVR